MSADEPTPRPDEYLDENGNRDPKTYIVLGVHRGGTSFLANALKRAGVTLGGSQPHFEDDDFVQLNKKILEAAGGPGAWRNPPSEAAIEAAVQARKDEIVELLRRKKCAFRGWKDPRQALTILNYLPYLEDDVYLVCIFRKPELIETSHECPWSQGVAIERAREYYRRIIHAVEEFVGITHDA